MQKGQIKPKKGGGGVVGFKYEYGVMTQNDPAMSVCYSQSLLN